MKLHEILGTPNLEGDVGIEIEVEGDGLVMIRSKGWTTKEDGSLRGGLEYVSDGPQPVGKTKEAILYLKNKLKNAKLRFSFRTSGHVHVNCLDMEYNHLLNYIYISHLLDSLLVNYCGDQRKGNRFCLRLADAEGVIDTLVGLFAYRNKPGRDLLRLIPNNTVRYAAVNVESIPKFGTIEFRSMRGTLDEEILVPWVETLVHIREYSKTFTDPKQVWEAVMEKGALEFIKEAVGEHFPKFYYRDMEYDFELNLSLAIDLPFTEEKVAPPIKEWSLIGANYTTERLMEILGRTPGNRYLRDLVIQGAHLDPQFREYFYWDEYLPLLEELKEQVAGVQELLDWVREW